MISNIKVQLTCNECDNNADCNLNGECQEDGTCKCFEYVDGVSFLGPHCEVKLRDSCRTIIGGEYLEVLLCYPFVCLFAEVNHLIYHTNLPQSCRNVQ